jgi:hypothetical protein
MDSCYAFKYNPKTIITNTQKGVCNGRTKL